MCSLSQATENRTGTDEACGAHGTALPDMGGDSSLRRDVHLLEALSLVLLVAAPQSHFFSSTADPDYITVTIITNPQLKTVATSCCCLSSPSNPRRCRDWKLHH
ncbi:hypothetical protein FF2_033805 [Malus domestica]